MARLLAAEVVAVPPHLLDDVAVADRGADHLAAPRRASARSRPMFDITVATSVFFFERARRKLARCRWP